MRFAISTLLFLVVAAQAGDDLGPSKPFTLSMDLWRVTGERLNLTVDVSEGETFRVMTTANDIRCTMKGNVGKSAGDTIPVKLTWEWFRNDKFNERGMVGVDLRLTGEKLCVGGIPNFFSITSFIKKNGLR